MFCGGIGNTSTDRLAFTNIYQRDVVTLSGVGLLAALLCCSFVQNLSVFLLLRLDGPSRHQLTAGIYGAGGHLAESLHGKFLVILALSFLRYDSHATLT